MTPHVRWTVVLAWRLVGPERLDNTRPLSYRSTCLVIYLVITYDYSEEGTTFLSLMQLLFIIIIHIFASSLSWEKNKRFAEQAAALVACLCLGLIQAPANQPPTHQTPVNGPAIQPFAKPNAPPATQQNNTPAENPTAATPTNTTANQPPLSHQTNLDVAQTDEQSLMADTLEHPPKHFKADWDVVVDDKLWRNLNLDVYGKLYKYADILKYI